MKKVIFVISGIVAVSFLYSIIIGAASIFPKRSNSNVKIDNMSNGLSLTNGKVQSQANLNNIYTANNGCGTGWGTGCGRA